MAQRPAQIPPRAPPSDTTIDRAAYVGSAEHKAHRWWDGLPEARVDASGKAHRPKKQKTTICPLVDEEERNKATEWVKSALRARQYRFLEADKDFPKHIWYYADNRTWFGFCVNGVAGH